jgi:hypothetical protein
MSRLAQQVQAMTDQLRKDSRKKKGRTMDDVQDDTLGGERIGDDIISEDVNSVTDAPGAAVDIEPDEAPAGAVAMKAPKKAKAAKTTAKKTTKPAKAVAQKKAAKPAKAAKAAKPAKAAKVAKAPKAPKEVKPKVQIGVDLSGSLKPVSVEGGDKNQFVNITFADGRGVKLWPSGYPAAKDRLKARDAMVAFLSKALL